MGARRPCGSPAPAAVIGIGRIVVVITLSLSLFLQTRRRRLFVWVLLWRLLPRTRDEDVYDALWHIIFPLLPSFSDLGVQLLFCRSFSDVFAERLVEHFSQYFNGIRFGKTIGMFQNHRLANRLRWTGSALAMIETDSSFRFCETLQTLKRTVERLKWVEMSKKLLIVT